MAVRLKVVRDIARTGVHIDDDVKMAGTHRDLDTHNFITRRRIVWKAGRGKGGIYSD